MKDKYGGAADKIIYDRFCLKRAIYKNTSVVIKSHGYVT